MSKMAISSILRQISYSFNTSTTYNFLLVNFVFVKQKEKNPKKGGGGGNRPPALLPLGSTTGVLGDAPLENFKNSTPRNGDFLRF